MSDTTATLVSGRNNPLRAVAYLSVGIFAFSVHDIVVKWVSDTYPLTEVLFFRTLTAALPMLLFVHLDAGLGAFRTRAMGLVLARAAILLVGYLAFYMGLAVLSIADAVALYSSVPLIILALAGPLLGERVGLLRILAVLAGFAGVIIMLRPGEGVLEPGALLIIVCAVLYSLAMVLGRRMGTSASASVLAFMTNAVFLAASIGLGIIFNVLQIEGLGHPSLDFLVKPWIVPTANDLLLMLSCGLTSAIGVAGLTFAYREAEANLVASFEYTALIWAGMWGYLVFGDIPKATTIIGAGLIVGAGLVALYGGKRRKA